MATVKLRFAPYMRGDPDWREGLANAASHLDNLNRTIKGFAASSPVGQLLRGERDFWRGQIRKGS